MHDNQWLNKLSEMIFFKRKPKTKPKVGELEVSTSGGLMMSTNSRTIKEILETIPSLARR